MSVQLWASQAHTHTNNTEKNQNVIQSESRAEKNNKQLSPDPAEFRQFRRNRLIDLQFDCIELKKKRTKLTNWKVWFRTCARIQQTQYI